MKYFLTRNIESLCAVDRMVSTNHDLRKCDIFEDGIDGDTDKRHLKYSLAEDGQALMIEIGTPKHLKFIRCWS